MRLSIQATKLFPSNGLYYAQLAEFEAYPPADQAVQLTWTAPGDDENDGTAASYDIRWSTSPMSAAAIWSTATVIDGPPAPQLAGASQSKVVSVDGLPAGASVWFSVRARDDEGNEGGISKGTTTAIN